MVSTLLRLGGVAASQSQNSSSATTGNAQKSAPATSSGRPAGSDPAQLFQQGQDALKRGRLDEAERIFREVLTLNPRLAVAYANLGVVYMRRKQWTKALEMLYKAKRLA